MCTGDSARRTGNEYVYQMLALQNIETLDEYGVTKIITQCPHCFNTLKNEYPDMGGNYDVFVPIYDGKYGRAYQQEQDPELWEFLSSSIGAYADLKLRLFHGELDYTVPYSNSVDFAAALAERERGR